MQAPKPAPVRVSGIGLIKILLPLVDQRSSMSASGNMHRFQDIQFYSYAKRLMEDLFNLQKDILTPYKGKNPQ